MNYKGTISCKTIEEAMRLLERADIELTALDLRVVVSDKALDWLDPQWGTYIWSLEPVGNGKEK